MTARRGGMVETHILALAERAERAAEALRADPGTPLTPEECMQHGQLFRELSLALQGIPSVRP